VLKAYVACFGADAVYVLDPVMADLLGPPVATGKGPLGLDILPNGHRLYVANILGNSVSVLDTRTDTVIASIDLTASAYPAAAPSTVVASPSGLAVYVLCGGDEPQVAIVDPLENTVVGSITLPPGTIPRDMALHSGALWVTDSVNGEIVVCNIEAQVSLEETIPAPKVGAIAGCPACSFLLFTAPTSIGLLDVTRRSVARDVITATTAPEMLVLDPEGRTVYLTDSGAESVQAYDVRTRTRLFSIGVEKHPEGIDLARGGRLVVVTGPSDDTVSLIDTLCRMELEQVKVGAAPRRVRILSTLS
jgi:YVTN family beta-propeller protein